MRELESRLSSREVEFEKYRQQIVAKPESKLQAELSIAQLEKVSRQSVILCWNAGTLETLVEGN